MQPAKRSCHHTICAYILFIICNMSIFNAKPMKNTPTLVLHFDINKCILMADPVKGFQLDDTVNSILCEYIWGKVSIDDETKPLADRWTVASATPSVHCPIEGTVTYTDFIENIARLPRSERRGLVMAFTREGSAGSICRPAFDDLKLQLTPPLDLLKSEFCQHLPGIKNGHYHILPSFFRLFRELISRELKFKLIFRTFGKDAPEIARELNVFCEGRHPLFPGPAYDTKHRISFPYDSMSILRTGPTAADVHAAYVSDEGCVRVATGSVELHNAMMRKLTEEKTCLFVQDHFEYWRSHGESDDSGKLLLIDNENDEEIHVFFDDNIEHDRSHIVDVREMSTFERIPFAETKGKYIRKAESFLAIRDELYFVKELDSLLRLHRYPGYC